MAVPVLAATIPDAATFAIAGLIALAGAFGVVLMRNPVHSALMLVMTLFGVAVLFVEENAQFLAAVQVIVYAGAIVVLFLFVIMLLGVDRRERLFVETFRGQRVLVLLLGAAVLVEVLLLAGGNHWTTGATSVAAPLSGAAANGASGATGVGGAALNNTSELGRSLFTTYLLPFEVTSALLVVAVVGAVVLARRPERRPGAPSSAAPAAETIPSDQPLGDPLGAAPAAVPGGPATPRLVGEPTRAARPGAWIAGGEGDPT